MLFREERRLRLKRRGGDGGENCIFGGWPEALPDGTQGPRKRMGVDIVSVHRYFYSYILPIYLSVYQSIYPPGYPYAYSINYNTM